MDREDSSHFGPLSWVTIAVPFQDPVPGLNSLLYTLAGLAMFRVWKGRVVMRSLLACAVPTVVVLGYFLWRGPGLAPEFDGLFLAAMGAQLLLPGLARGLVVGLLIGLGFRWANRAGPQVTT